MPLPRELPVINFTGRPNTPEMTDMGIIEVLPHFYAAIEQATRFNSPPSFHGIRDRCNLFSTAVNIVCEALGIQEGYALVEVPSFMSVHLVEYVDLYSPCEVVYGWYETRNVEVPCGDGSVTVMRKTVLVDLIPTFA